MENVEQQSQGQETVGLTDQVSAPSGGDSAAQVYDIGGEQVTVDQIKQWKSGFMMNDDYTRKTQELAQMRDELKPYREMADYLKANPTQAQRVYNALSEQPADIDPKDAKVQQLERVVQGMIIENSKKDAANRIERVKGDPKYDGLFNNQAMEELLLAKALQTGDFDLGKTADEIHKVVLGMKASTKLETERKIQQNLNSPTRQGVSGAGTISVPKEFNPSKASSRDLEKVAMEMLS
jgi:hypothetical protein